MAEREKLNPDAVIRTGVGGGRNLMMTDVEMKSKDVYPQNVIFVMVMPTVLHIHAEKGDMECKYWLLIDEVEIREAFSHNMTPAAQREVKKIIYQHFDIIVDSWKAYFNK